MKLIRKLIDYLRLMSLFARSYDLFVRSKLQEMMSNHPNPINKCGIFGFSQNEEDGLIAEIAKRIGIKKGRFIEYGVGNGTENNTLTLVMRGWIGAWVGGEDIAFNLSDSSILSFDKVWLNKDNFLDFLSDDRNAYNLVSIDLDGNDYHFVKIMLEAGYCPDIFIVEYNSKFPPDIAFVMPYREEHTWGSNDYFGASLYSWCELFNLFHYRLVCCNITGSNAFFVRRVYSNCFLDIPEQLHELFCPAFHYSPVKKMHPTSISTIKHFI